MWTKLTSRVSDENITRLLERAEVFIASADKGAVHWGKEFFKRENQEEHNLDLLRRFHLDIWPEIADIVDFRLPVIDHAALLIKGAGGAATRLHQDSAYWVGREATPSVFSVWIALDDMSEEKGGLILSRRNEIDVSDMSSFNTGVTFEHETVADLSVSGGFPFLIPTPIASQLAESMEFINLARGEAAAFDSYEPHMTGPNITSTPRLAMKIAYAEGNENTQKHPYLALTDALESCRSCDEES